MARQPRTKPIPFNQKLVLNRYLLGLLGADDFQSLAGCINKPEQETAGRYDISNFLRDITIFTLDRHAPIAQENLLRYHKNITTHTNEINEYRPEKIQWKYFQYLALLFTEIYLDQYFNNQEDLLSNLNEHYMEINNPLPTGERLQQHFNLEELNRAAFWSATGSGKTLIMHVNIKQFRHYLSKAIEEGKNPPKINRTLLITPNDGLSRQHLEELELSGISAKIFNKDASSMFRELHEQDIEIISITKFDDKDGNTQVDVDSFEDNNLVLTDEAHRGSKGEKWGNYRRKLARNGFTFEYSATLGQAAAASKKLATTYAKSILFDYSYKHFYGDGYGKQHHIMNYPSDADNENRDRYLIACMLAFYQQKMLFDDPEAEALKFNIENPLCVFVGSSVNAAKAQAGQRVPDVVDILLFLARFTFADRKQEMLAHINKIKSGNPELSDQGGHNVLEGMFPKITNLSAEEIYEDMLVKIFNASNSAKLHLYELKGADGEIALKLGDYPDFGVINVGDASALCRLCEKFEELAVSPRNYNNDSDSLFHTINSNTSNINILIGSKKFTEGWNSWRVSTMGLLNVGTGEGHQIIQLFGRGVRLRGLNKSLKRHSALGENPNDKLSLLEKLNIFGIRANYMEKFKEYLEAEGQDTENIKQIYVNTTKTLGEDKLKIIKVKDEFNFKKDGEPNLSLSENFKIKGIVHDYYPRIQSRDSGKTDDQKTAIAKHETQFKAKHIKFLDYDALFFDLQRLKKEREWFNLSISKDQIKTILEDTSWYVILIPEDQLAFDDYRKVHNWQEIASDLMLQYCDRFYKKSKAEMEIEYREYSDLDDNHTNFFDQYEIHIKESKQELITQIEEKARQIREGNLDYEPDFSNSGKFISFAEHLYQPLIYAGNNDIQIKPTYLNNGEKKFIEDIKAYYAQEKNTSFTDKKLYLLRNMSKKKGIGFFEADDFYPDFIMWLIIDDKQYITFIDPKGLHHLHPTHPKIEFYEEIKKIQTEMGDDKVTLNSVIISISRYEEIKNRFLGWVKSDLNDKNVLFLEDNGYIEQVFEKALL